MGNQKIKFLLMFELKKKDNFKDRFPGTKTTFPALPEAKLWAEQFTPLTGMSMGTSVIETSRVSGSYGFI